MNLINVLLAIVAVGMFPFAILSTVILSYAIRSGPRIGVLTERSFIALAIAFMLGSGALLTINRLLGHALFPTDIATVVFSVSLIVLGAVPVNWVRLWYQGKLGEDAA